MVAAGADVGVGRVVGVGSGVGVATTTTITGVGVGKGVAVGIEVGDGVAVTTTKTGSGVGIGVGLVRGSGAVAWHATTRHVKAMTNKPKGTNLACFPMFPPSSIYTDDFKGLTLA